MADDIQEWAKQRACDLANAEITKPGYWMPQHVESSGLLQTLAKHIQQHEKPPVDEAEALYRKILTVAGWINAGERYLDRGDRAAVELLRNRIELASQQGDG